ncbi:MAG: acyl-CoA dehydrogenase family protein [Rhodospirillales bacterium]
MTLDLPQDARQWQARLKHFVDEALIPYEVEAEMNDGLIDPAVRAGQRETALAMGLPGMDVPRDLGGLGLSTLTQVVLYEQIGRVTNGLGWCFSEAHRWMFEACSPDQIERFVRPIMLGRRHECYAITEAEAGSDVEALATTARPEGNGYRLDGEKWHVTSANLADVMIVQAKLTDGPSAGSHALFFVEMESDGLEILRTPAYSHTYESHHPIYRLNRVFVPAADRIGAEGDGMAFTQAWFRRERLMIAARCCGAAERLIDEATAFAKQRMIGGHPLAERQAIQFMLADSLTELFAARLMTYEAARAHDRGEDVKVLHGLCSMVKLNASEMANRVADRAVQIFGGRGYMRENVAERFFRELRVERIWEGTSEIQRLIVAKNLLKRGQDALIG